MDDKFYANISLNYHESTADNTGFTTNVTQTGSHAQYLPNILAGMTRFLQAMGFTYVDELKAFGEEDYNCSSNDGLA